MIAVTTSGPLFQGTLDVKRGMRVGMERATARAGDIAREHLRPRSRYSTPKYGHAAQSVVTKIVAVGGDQLQGSARIGGQAAYLGGWLEFGTKAHPIPKVRVRGSGSRRSLVRKQTTLAFRAGGALLFRATANHPGTRAYRWRSQSQEQVNREAPAIFEAAMAEALKANG